MTEAINWLEWDKKTFEKADKENKPIIMDIFGQWCHWCHEMDRNTYSDPYIIKEINDNFIAIKVDTDKRPDINERYNQGGWPTTVFMNPEGDFLTGATYIPPLTMKSHLYQIWDRFRKGQIDPIVLITKESKPDKEATKSIIDDSVKLLFDNYDNIHGGFGSNQKFPLPATLEFLLLFYEDTKNKDYLDIVENTIDNMTNGLMDKYEGGFFRYSVTSDWNQPHYEKMIATNSEIISLISHVYKITNDKKYLHIIEKTVNYILSILSDPNGGFYSSQDADKEEEYYGLSLEERKKLKTPHIDKIIYADLNGLALEAFIKYYEISKDEKTKEFILKTFDLLEGKYFNNGFDHYLDSKLSFLSDNGNMAIAFLEAYRVFKDEKYLTQAKKLADIMINKFWDPEAYGFNDKIINEDDVGRLKEGIKNMLHNSRITSFLLDLHHITKDGKYRDYAHKTLQRFVDIYPNYSFHGFEYLVAVYRFLNEEIK